MTLQELIKKAETSEFFVPADLGEVLGCNPHNIRVQAREAPELLQFPVIVIGTRTRIPARPFLEYMGVKMEVQK